MYDFCQIFESEGHFNILVHNELNKEHIIEKRAVTSDSITNLIREINKNYKPLKFIVVES